MLMLLILLIPFWVGEIVRTYAIMIFLGNTGAVNLVLKWFGLIERPIPFMYTGFSMGVGIVYLTALYMLLPLYSALEKLPKSYTEVAADLGAGAWVRFRKITLPLSFPGILGGSILVFIPITTFMARIGAKTVHKIDKNKISKFFGIFLLVVAVKFMLEYFKL